MNNFRQLFGFILLLFSVANASAEQKSPHYSEQGFFDIHVCNWPDNNRFFMALFSTYEFARIKSIQIHDQGGHHVGNLDLNKYRLVNTEKGEKRVFIKHLDLKPGNSNGWYTGTVVFKDDSVVKHKDFVELVTLDRAKPLMPLPNAEEEDVPDVLKWTPIKGASNYQIFIKDLWDSEKVILTSDILDKPEYKLEPGLLKPGGYYSWRIHARNVNGDAMHGDFNHGSLSIPFEFSIAEK